MGQKKRSVKSSAIRKSRKIVMYGLGSGETCDWCQKHLNDDVSIYNTSPKRYFCSEECKKHWFAMKNWHYHKPRTNPDEKIRQMARSNRDPARELLERERSGLISPKIIQEAAKLGNAEALAIYPEITPIQFISREDLVAPLVSIIRNSENKHKVFVAVWNTYIKELNEAISTGRFTKDLKFINENFNDFGPRYFDILKTIHQWLSQNNALISIEVNTTLFDFRGSRTPTGRNDYNSVTAFYDIIKKFIWALREGYVHEREMLGTRKKLIFSLLNPETILAAPSIPNISNPDERIRKLSRQGEDPARILLEKERAGQISPHTIKMAAMLQNPIAARIYPELTQRAIFDLGRVWNEHGIQPVINHYNEIFSEMLAYEETKKPFYVAVWKQINFYYLECKRLLRENEYRIPETREFTRNCISVCESLKLLLENPQSSFEDIKKFLGNNKLQRLLDNLGRFNEHAEFDGDADHMYLFNILDMLGFFYAIFEEDYVVAAESTFSTFQMLANMAVAENEGVVHAHERNPAYVYQIQERLDRLARDVLTPENISSFKKNSARGNPNDSGKYDKPEYIYYAVSWSPIKIVRGFITQEEMQEFRRNRTSFNRCGYASRQDLMSDNSFIKPYRDSDWSLEN